MQKVITSEQIKDYANMVHYFARIVAKKMDPTLRGKSFIDEKKCLNLRGDTYEDIVQELSLQVWFALRKDNPENATTERGTKSEKGWVFKFLEDRGVRFIQDMWTDKGGQKHRHISGFDAEAFFNHEMTSEAISQKKGE